MSTKALQRVARSALRGPKIRLHFHEPVLFDFPKQTTLINRAVLKAESSKLIPELQAGSLQKSFDNVMMDGVEGVIDDNGLKSLYRKVYKPFLKDGDLAKYFSNAAIVNQVGSYLSSNLKLRDGAHGLLDYVADKGTGTVGAGILRTDYLKTVGVIDQHYKTLLFRVGEKAGNSTFLTKFKPSRPMSSFDSLQNELTVLEYLEKVGQGSSNTTDYLIINCPAQAESLTTLAFKLGMKVVVITEPYFEKPTSTLTDLIYRFKEANRLDNAGECKHIKTQLSNLDQIAVKDLDGFLDFLQIVQEEKSMASKSHLSSVDESSFWGKLYQMELSILGELESKMYEPVRKSY